MAKDPYRYFRVEARELLEQLDKATLDLEKSTAGTEQIAHLLRLAHTLKGAARVIKQREISDLAHGVEDALAPYRDSGERVPRACVDSVLATLDAMNAKLAQLPAPASGDTLAPSIPVEPTRTVRADVADVDVMLEGLTQVHGELAAVRRAVNRAGRASQIASLLANQLASPRIEAAYASHQTTMLAKTRTLAEELQAQITTFEHGVAGGLERVDRELRQTRELIERLRLVPAGSVFNVLERAVRDAAHSTGRRVTFDVSGADARLDGHVLDAVRGALEQIVRNAVAHGIESETERMRAGKPVAGRVTLDVIRRRHRVSFICHDDGRGVDLEAVRQLVQRKGGVPRGAERLGAAELLSLLLKGGISTSGTVTELSGRGIGLDVVREAADRLGGEVSVQTAPGTGTTVELCVPVSIASLEALMVNTDGEAVAIPLDAVRTTLRLALDDVMHTPEGDAIVHEGNLIPLIPLAASLAYNAGVNKFKGGSLSVVIVAGTTAAVAVAVDRLLGTETLTQRALPALAPVDAIVTGAYIDSEGNPRPVLDPQALAKCASRLVFRPEVTPSPRPILVIDDSLTTRMLEQSILESAGYQVELATSGEQALEIARRNDFGLFLVDVEMPGMDGFTFIERSRADPLLRNVPCILVTSRDAPDDRRRGQAVGACAYIVKSEFDQVGLLDRITGLMRP